MIILDITVEPVEPEEICFVSPIVWPVFQRFQFMQEYRVIVGN